MTYNVLPLQNVPQSFSIILGGVTYTMTCKYNEIQGWTLDIADINSVPIVSNIPLTTGRDLLEPFGYLNFGGKLFAYTDTSDAPPTLDNLGIDSNLYFVTEP